MRERYLQELNDILNIADVDLRNKMFQEKYLEYCKYCYSNNILSYDYKLDKKASSTFLLESTPVHFDVDPTLLASAINSLKMAQDNISSGMNDGISVDEAAIILRACVNNARAVLRAHADTDFDNNSLSGSCGFGQALTGIPLSELGVPVTINNASGLPDSDVRHAFITCSFPIYDGEKYYNKEYLVDTTYRQFFLTIMSTAANYYDGDRRSKDKCGPEAGYYIMQNAQDINIARTLIKNGYIELDENVARTYGSAFSKVSICLSSSRSDIERVSSHTGSEYFRAMHEVQEEFDYTREDFDSWNIHISLTDNANTKKHINNT